MDVQFNAYTLTKLIKSSKGIMATSRAACEGGNTVGNTVIISRRRAPTALWPIIGQIYRIAGQCLDILE